MIKIQNKVDCCGCNACGDVCAKGAITFKTDIEGFWYPEVDATKCTDCGLCEKVCPVINKDEWHTSGGFTEPKAYAVVHKNIEVRFDSTSGGAFSALAEEVYKQGGYVGGAVFNEDWSVSQIISSNKEDLAKLRSSKYLQSHCDGFFIAVRDAVKTGKPVLVCGSPCQMAALHRFLRKPYDNLIIMDYICRGIPSPLLFKKFIEYLEEKHNSKVVYFKAKNKELGWHNLTSKIIFANNDVEYIGKGANPWLQIKYEVPETCRHSCFECPFKGFPRTSDLTCGDLWTTPGSIPAHLDNDLGTSIVFANSEKGAAFLDKCKKKVNFADFPLQKAIDGNRHLVKPLKHSNHNREEFYKDLNDSFATCVDKYIPYLYNKTYSAKDKIINTAKFIRQLINVSGWNIWNWFVNIYYNIFCKQVKANILEGKCFYVHPSCVIDLAKDAEIILNASLTLGKKTIKGSKLETRLLVRKGGKLIIKKLPYAISYGADIEVFENGLLEIEGGRGTNIGFTVVCANHIYIGEYTGCGRNVTIRDNNGNHFISVRGYKTSQPVIIKNHVWMTESCTIMPGTTIEAGAIISARSVVSGHVPCFAIMKGDPAVVVEKNILWKA